MSKVIINITMSLDGFVTGLNDGIGNGLGDGGMILHEWAREGRTEADLQLLQDPENSIGCTILGRRTFDIAEQAWGNSPPFEGEDVFVLTHRPHETIVRGSTKFIFVTDAIEDVLDRARRSTPDKDIHLMGANISQQYLKAGLVDEMEIHVANVLLGAGRPLFAHIGDKHIKLERIRVIATPSATHLRYRVLQ